MNRINFVVLLIAILNFEACSNQQQSNTKAETSSMKTYQSDSLHLSFAYPANWELRTEGNHIGLYEGLENTDDNFQENMIIWTEEMPMTISDSLYAKASIAEIKIKNPDLKIDPSVMQPLGNKKFYSFNFVFKNHDSSDYKVQGYTLVHDKRAYNFSCTSTKEKSASHRPIFESILESIKPQ